MFLVESSGGMQDELERKYGCGEEETAFLNNLIELWFMYHAVDPLTKEAAFERCKFHFRHHG